MEEIIKAPIITFSRLRMATDGEGITTLVCFHGCPLRCKWCINPFSYKPDTKYTNMTPADLYDKVKLDSLYYLTTGGGITFGGGEPLLYPEFIKEFCSTYDNGWKYYIETSLNVPWENVEAIADCIDRFIIDCKDTNPQIYRSYTGRDNKIMLDNLERLVRLVGAEKIILRLPLIPDFNTESDREKSKELLSRLDVSNFDFFTYKV